jgi:hypothetical protein
MFARVNRKNKTAFAGNVTPSGLGIFYSVPFNGCRKGAKLTIKQDGTRVDLSTSQVKSLQKVLAKARRLAAAE